MTIMSQSIFFKHAFINFYDNSDEIKRIPHTIQRAYFY